MPTNMGRKNNQQHTEQDLKYRDSENHENMHMDKDHVIGDELSPPLHTAWKYVIDDCKSRKKNIKSINLQ